MTGTTFKSAFAISPASKGTSGLLQTDHALSADTFENPDTLQIQRLTRTADAEPEATTAVQAL